MRQWTKRECIGLRNLKCNMVCDVFVKKMFKNVMETISNLAMHIWANPSELNLIYAEIFVHKVHHSFAMCKSL